MRTPAQWDGVWRRLADSVPIPSVNLTDSVILVVATQEFVTGPHPLTIDGVRRCRGSDTVVALVRMHKRELQQDYGDRTVLAITLSRATLHNSPVRFIDLPDIVDR